MMNKPFRTRDAETHGISPSQLRSSAYRRLFHGVAIASNRVLDQATRVEAARLVLPTDARLTGLTALRMAGLDLLDDFPLVFETTHPHAVRRGGVQVRRVAELVSPGGVAPVPEAFAAFCAMHDLRDSVEVGDRLIQLRRGELADLHDVAPRKVARLLREGSESNMETRLRLLRCLAGLPEPDLQVDIYDGCGVWLGRVDELDPEFKVICEYEGRHHLTDPAQWSKDVARYEAMVAEGYIVLRFTAEHLRDPVAVVHRIHRIHRALVSHGYRGPKPSFGDRWCAVAGIRARNLDLRGQAA
ncbi:DUF559 domain-containing protein [Mariniluteicoccus flavus]